MQDLSRWIWVSTKPAADQPAAALHLLLGSTAEPRRDGRDASVLHADVGRRLVGLASGSRTSRTTRSKSITIPAVPLVRRACCPMPLGIYSPTGKMRCGGNTWSMRFAKRRRSAASVTRPIRAARPRVGLALQLEASLKAIDDAGLKPARHRRRHSLFPRRRHRRGLHRQSRPARSHAVAVRADGRRHLRGGDPERRDGGGDRRLQERPDLGRPHRLLGRAGQHPPAAVPAIRAGRRVRGADRHVRAGPALRPGRAPPHAALRHDGAPFRRGRGGDAPARHPQRQRRDEQAAHRRGASRLAHDLRSVPAVRLQPGERRRCGDHRQRRRPREAI